MNSDIENLYQGVIKRHYRDPTYRKTLPPPAISGEMLSRSCGDRVKIFLLFDESGHVAESSYQGEGCSISIASASMLCSAVIGKTKAEIAALAGMIIAFLESDSDDQHEREAALSREARGEELIALKQVRRYATRVPCALLAWKSLAGLGSTSPQAGI